MAHVVCVPLNDDEGRDMQFRSAVFKYVVNINVDCVLVRRQPTMTGISDRVNSSTNIGMMNLNL